MDAYTEERVASGFDVELQGRLPQFPTWQANLKGFQWSSNAQMEGNTTWGYDAGVQWQPFNALIWEAGVLDEQDAKPSVHTALRMIYRFGDSIEKMWERPVALADVGTRIYDKVRRENAIRIERRVKLSSYATVTQNIGANTVQLPSGTVGLTVGLVLARPFTVTTDATPGSVARIGFQDGGVLTIGAGSQVEVNGQTVTLIAGMFHYVDGSTNTTINIPGGTVTLLGTDVPVTVTALEFTTVFTA